VDFGPASSLGEDDAKPRYNSPPHVSSPRETILDCPFVEHRLSERTMRNPGTIPHPTYRPLGRRYLTVNQQSQISINNQRSVLVQHRLSERTMRNPGTIPHPTYRPLGRRYLTFQSSSTSLGEDDAKPRYDPPPCVSSPRETILDS
jgi:hypothetical protein